jgi:Cys-tRNA(Pro)/Cys-tRNA(Cys) deacylase
VASLGEQALAAKGITFVAHEYDYRKKGADAAAAALGAELGALLKTLVVRLSDGQHVLLLMPGQREASLRGLARELGSRSAELTSERDAERLTGYRVGGIGPFGVRTPMAVLLDVSAAAHQRVFVNGGRRGLILELALDDLVDAADAELVDASIDPLSRKP